jgi:hypothetical protein
MGVVAPERPLVHVFLVQENMPIDTMQAVSSGAVRRHYYYFMQYSIGRYKKG